MLKEPKNPGCEPTILFEVRHPHLSILFVVTKMEQTSFAGSGSSMYNPLLPASFSNPLGWFSAHLQGCFFLPIIGRQRHSPNIPWLIQFDPAVLRILRVDINNASRSPLVRHVDLYRNSHPRSQPDCGCDQCSLKMDDYGLAIARPSLRATLDGDYHLQWDPSAASGFMKGFSHRQSRIPRFWEKLRSSYRRP